MAQAVLNQRVYEHFSVADTTGTLLAGIDTSSFIVYIYDPNGNEISSSVSLTIEELTNGSYKASFVPNQVGTWYVVILHEIYFPWGKTDDVQVEVADLSDIYSDVTTALGLLHHNIYIDNTVFDDTNNLISARVRLYSDSVSVGSDLNVFATYLITAGSAGTGRFSYWQQVAI